MTTEESPNIERLTPYEARAVRLACIFGTPHPTPPEIISALSKIKAIEDQAPGDRPRFSSHKEDR